MVPIFYANITESGTGASVLMKAPVTVYSEADCGSIWGSNNILSQHICVKGDNAGSCNVCIKLIMLYIFVNTSTCTK